MVKEILPFLSVRNISLAYRQETGLFYALKNVSLDVYEGECLFAAGSNGSGKTALMKILAGLAEPSAGECLFGGKPYKQCLKELRRTVGLVFQDPDAQILGETIEEDAAFGPVNLGFGAEEAKRRARAAIESLGLEGKLAVPPRRLSGGEKRRLAAAGVIAMGCRVVIFDEPFANLDWPSVEQVLRIIKQLKAEGKTVIVLTHELEKALAYADRLAILHAGELRALGAPTEVLDTLKPEWGVRDPRCRRHPWCRCDTAEDCTWLRE